MVLQKNYSLRLRHLFVLLPFRIWLLLSWPWCLFVVSQTKGKRSWTNTPRNVGAYKAFPVADRNCQHVWGHCHHPSLPPAIHRTSLVLVLMPQVPSPMGGGKKTDSPHQYAVAWPWTGSELHCPGVADSTLKHFDCSEMQFLELLLLLLQKNTMGTLHPCCLSSPSKSDRERQKPRELCLGASHLLMGPQWTLSPISAHGARSLKGSNNFGHR